MIKNRNKLLAVFLAALMCCSSLLAACAKNDKEPESGKSAETATSPTAAATEPAPTGNSWEKYKNDPVTLKMFIDNPSAVNLDNMLMDRIREDTGITLDIEGGDNDHSKLNLKIASNDLPDLIWTFNNIPQVKKLVEGGLVANISELSEKYAPNVVNNMSDIVKLTLRMEMNSKDIFAVAGGGDIPKDEANNPLINKNTQVVAVAKEIYEELGQPEAKTTDEMLSLLRQAKTRHPELIPFQAVRTSGSEPTYGLPAAFWGLYPNFGLQEAYFKGDNGYFGLIEHPNFVKLLKFINTMYNEGLMSKTEFTDSPETALANIRNGKVFVIGRDESNNLTGHSEKVAEVKPNYNYMAIEPFTPEGTEYGFDEIAGGTGYGRLFIAASSKYQERAIVLADYLKSVQMEFMTIFGPREGEDWIIDPADGYPRWTEQGQNIFINAAANPDYKAVGMLSWTWMRNGIAILYTGRGPGEVTEKEKKNREYQAIAAKYYKDFSRIALAQPTDYPSGSEEEKIATTIKDYFGKETVKIAVGKPENVESDFAKLLEKVRSMGLDKLNAFTTRQFENLDAKIKEYSE